MDTCFALHFVYYENSLLNMVCRCLCGHAFQVLTLYIEVVFVGPLHTSLKNKLFFQGYTILHLNYECIIFFHILLLPQTFQVVVMRNFFHRLLHLNTWFQVDVRLQRSSHAGGSVSLGEGFKYL